MTSPAPGSSAGRFSYRVLPHDERVLAVIGVVAATDSPSREAEALVELDRRIVRDSYLERVAAASVAGGELEEPLHQPRGDPLAPVAFGNSEVHHVPGVDVAGDDQVGDEAVLVGVDRAEADRRRFRELAREHGTRPWRWVGAALDALDRIEIAELQLTELEG